MRILLMIALTVAATAALAADNPAGLWEWTETEVSEGVVTTPGDAGYTLHREFRDDLTYGEYVDDTLARSGTYDFYDYRAQIGPNEYVDLMVLRITVDGVVESAGYGIGEDGALGMCFGSDPYFGLPSYPCERYVRSDIVGPEPWTWSAAKASYR